MEYCKGGSVIEALQRFSEKNERIIASIMKQLLSALSYMHSLNIIHRDIKLDNIVFLSKSEDCISIKIIDFGTAVQTPHKIVQNYPIAGTLSYLAPEVLKETLTEKSDIWSSGVLMYILLTGVSPFKGKNEKETKANIFKKIIDIDAPPL
jgi:calcium-dependent protein kinase